MSQSKVPMMWGRAEQVGVMVAGLDVPMTFQRTLMPRSLADQAIITGLNSAIVSALASSLQDVVQSAALALTGGAGDGGGPDQLRWSRATFMLDLAVIGAGIGVQRVAAPVPDESLLRATIRSSGWTAAETGVAGAIVGLFQEAFSKGGKRRPRVPVVVPASILFGAAGELRRRRREAADHSVPPSESTLPFAKSLAMSAAVGLGTIGFSAARRGSAHAIGRTASRWLPGNEHFWRPVGDVVTLGALALGGRAAVQFVYRRIENTASATEPAFDLAPVIDHVSGAAGSLIPYDSMSTQGRRFVWTARTAERVEEVMGEPGADAIRVFVGLDTAPTEEERVQLAIEELERLGAFDREWLLLVSPTGTGYVNYAAVGAFEFLARGRCATAAMQYSLRPSVLSLDKVAQGRLHMRHLLVAIQGRLADRPEAERPRLMLFGESLGAWTSQDAFLHEGTLGLLDRDVDRSIWIGTPHESGWKRQVFREDRPDVDRSLVGEFHELSEYLALSDEERDRLKYVLITHGNDGVALMGFELAVQAPTWLGPPEERPKKVPAGMRWQAITSFLQVLIDMKNSMQVVPGVFAANGHDYRADLPGFFRVVMGIPTTDDQLERIFAALETDERVRSDWIAEAKETGGMAEVIARRVVELDPEGVKTALLARREELLAAGAERLNGANGSPP